jgi:hypothetical protein
MAVQIQETQEKDTITIWKRWEKATEILAEARRKALGGVREGTTEMAL